MFAYGIEGCRRGRPGHRTGKCLRRGGEAAAPRRGRHRRRGRTERDRRSSPTRPPTPSSRRRPAQPGRARPRSAAPCWSPTRPPSPTRAERELGGQVAADQAPRAHHRGADRPRSRAWCWSRHGARCSRWSTRTPPSTWRSTPPRAAGRRAGPATPARSSSGRTRRSRSATTSAGSNHVLPTGGTCRHTGGLSVSTFLRGMHVVTTTEQALAAGSAARRRARATPRTCPHTWKPCGASGPAGERPGRAAAARRSARPRPYGAPQLDVPVRSTPTRTPTRRRRGCRRARTRRRLPRGLNRYPDRDAVALREDLAGYLGHRRRRARPGVGGQRLKRDLPAAAAGVRRARAVPRSASSRRTRCTPSSPGDRHAVGRAAARRGLRGRCRAAPRRDRRARPGRRLPDLAEQPDRHRAAARDVEAVLKAAPGMVVVDEAYAEFRRDRRAERAYTATRQPAARGDPDDEQGVRDGRAAARLPELLQHVIALGLFAFGNLSRTWSQIEAPICLSSWPDGARSRRKWPLPRLHSR